MAHMQVSCRSIHQQNRNFVLNSRRFALPKGSHTARGSVVLNSIVSRTSLPGEFQEQNGYKLQFVVFSRLAPSQTTSTLQEHLSEHEAWLKSLDGQLVFHGPFLNAEATYYGSEMYALTAESAADARQIVEQDPLHSKGIRKFELMSWVQNTSW